jgi:hypothetical protein
MATNSNRVWRRFACAASLVLVLPVGFLIVGLPGVGVAIARTLEVGSDKPYKVPSLAAADAKDGDHILIGPGEYFDCAVWRANNLVIEDSGPDAMAIVTDKTCMGKAIFVIAGNDTTVRNLTLTRARVPDMNGAGIRTEGRKRLRSFSPSAIFPTRTRFIAASASSCLVIT